MKYAKDPSGQKIKAGAGAPLKALCPFCRGTVTLRMRRRGNPSGEVTYFWRHENHANPGCPARFKSTS